MQPDGSNSFDVVVFGAGVTGLSLAWELARRRAKVLLLESADRAGGVVQTVREGGYLLELGPNSFSSSPPELLELVERVGLRSRAILRPMRDHDRYIWKRGALRRVPTGPGGMITTDVLTMGEKLRAAAGLFRGGPALDEDPTLGGFFRSRVGDGVVETFLKPFVAGIYAADADRVSFAATFPKLHDALAGGQSLVGGLRGMKRAAGSGKRAPRSLVSFPDGLQELPRRLVEDLVRAGGKMRLGVKATLARAEHGAWQITMPGSPAPVTTRRVVLATPAREAARLLAGVAPDATAALGAVEYARLNVIHVGAAASRFREARPGFGFLSVANQGVDILGSIWSSNIFPGRAPEGHRLITCFFGGEKHLEANDWDDARLEAAVRADLVRTMGFDGGAFDLLRITRWDGALPIFRPGHRDMVARLLGTLPPGLELAGSFLGGVSMPDRVVAASAMAQT